MEKSTRIAGGAVALALGALVAITPRFLFPVCEYYGVRMDMGMGKTEHMHCFYTGRASLMAGALIGLIGVTLFLAKRKETIRLLSLVLGGAALAVIIIPAALFPICQNPDMHCNHGTMPLLIVLGIGTLMTSGWLGFTARKSAAARTSTVLETDGAV